MTQAVKLEPEDVKKILAEHFGVDPKQVIKAQYSYFVETAVPEKKE